MLETFYFIAQILAALAVVGSLIFVGLQVRAQTIEQQIHRIHERASISSQINTWVISDPIVRQTVAKAYNGLDELTDEEFGVYMVFVRQALIFLQLACSQLPDGPLDARSQSAFAVLARLMVGEGFRQWWGHFCHDYPEQLRVRIDEIIEWAKTGNLAAYPGRESLYTAGGVSHDA